MKYLKINYEEDAFYLNADRILLIAPCKDKTKFNINTDNYRMILFFEDSQSAEVELSRILFFTTKEKIIHYDSNGIIEKVEGTEKVLNVNNVNSDIVARR